MPGVSITGNTPPDYYAKSRPITLRAITVRWTSGVEQQPPSSTKYLAVATESVEAILIVRHRALVQLPNVSPRSLEHARVQVLPPHSAME